MCGARTIVTSSSDAKLERAKALGATHTINYVKTPVGHPEVRALKGGRGVDHVIEVGGPDASCSRYRRFASAVRSIWSVISAARRARSTARNPLSSRDGARHSGRIERIVRGDEPRNRGEHHAPRHRQGLSLDRGRRRNPIHAESKAFWKNHPQVLRTWAPLSGRAQSQMLGCVGVSFITASAARPFGPYGLPSDSSVSK